MPPTVGIVLVIMVTCTSVSPIRRRKKKFASTHAQSRCTDQTHTPNHWIHSSSRLVRIGLRDKWRNFQCTTLPYRSSGLWRLDRPVSPARTGTVRCNMANCQDHKRRCSGICRCRNRSTWNLSLCLDRSLPQSLRFRYRTSVG